ncbi:MAG: C-terminal target protein, partial [Verrucomicrobiales bacterium]|nr:C-terminal target protein [Verrucomicrobiales bacterium]
IIQSSASTLINLGTINAEIPDQVLTLSINSFTNSGTLNAINGAILTINNTAWINNGTLHVDNSTVNLGGNFSGNSATNGFSRNGGIVNITGTLNDGLILNDAAGSWNLSGTIKNGTVSASGGAQLQATGGTLSGVTLASDINIANGKSLTIANGLTFAGGAKITLNSTGDATYLFNSPGTQTIDGTGEIVFAGGSSGNTMYLGYGGETKLTVGSNVTLRGRGNIVQSSASTLINLGTISAEIPDQPINISANTFTNTGTLRAVNGSTLNVTGPSSSNSGSGGVQVDASSSISFNGNIFGDTTSKDHFNIEGTLLLTGGATNSPRYLETMGEDRGFVLAGFSNNFAYGTIALANNAHVKLVDLSQNSAGVGSEALYLDSLIVPSGATFDLSGLHLYARNIQIADPGSILDGTVAVALPKSAITASPSSSPVPGTQVVLTAAFSGSEPLQFQWRFNGDNIPGETNSTYTIDSVQVADSGNYSCLVVNAFGVAISSAIDLQVQIPAIILTDIFAQRHVYTEASNVGFSGNTTATGPELGEPKHARKAGGHSVWLAWHAPASGIARFRTSGSNFDTLLAVYTGPAVNTLQVVASDEDAGGYFTSALEFNAVAGTEYQIAVDGFAGASGRIVLSWSLEPTTLVVPSITTPPVSYVVAEGMPVDLHVAASPATVTYQWMFNGTNIAGANSDTLHFSQVSSDQVGLYRVLVSAGTLSVLSDPAFIEISSASDAVLSQDKLPDLVNAPAGLKARSGGSSFPLVSAGVFGYQLINNFGASISGNDPNFTDAVTSASKWSGLTASTNGIMVIDTIGSEIDTVLAVYPANADITTVQPIAADDNGAPDGIRSRVQFPVQAGATYSIVAAGVRGAQGKIKINWILGSLPTITVAPVNQTAGLGDSVTFTVVASGTPTPTYQWFFNDQPIARATAPTLNRTGIQSDQIGRYKIEVRNPLGLAYAEAILTLSQLETLRFDPGDYALSSGVLDLQIHPAVNNRPTILESSADLINWTSVFTNTTSLKFKFSLQTTQNYLFFRTVEK